MHAAVVVIPATLSLPAGLRVTLIDFFLPIILISPGVLAGALGVSDNQLFLELENQVLCPWDCLRGTMAKDERE